MNAAVQPCIYGNGGRAIRACEIGAVSLGKGYPFIHAAQESNRRGGLHNHRERLSKAAMVDLLGMFRRRPAKRGPPGFARPRVDITSLGDRMGEMLSSPVRDAPPIARETPLPRVEAPRAEKPRPAARAPSKVNGAAAAAAVEAAGLPRGA